MHPELLQQPPCSNGARRTRLRAAAGCRGGALLVLLALLTAGCAARNGGSDRAWYDQQGMNAAERPALYRGAVRTSQHIHMPDGVQIALDLYLPEGLPPGRRVPTILMQTRYVRSLVFRWPFRPFLKGRFDDLIEYFVTRGYAWVYVDVRGTGASFGTRPYPYAEEEILDGAQITGWIVRQPWSDGHVGSMGSSYDGDAALFLLSTGHPAVKAIMPRYVFLDGYADVVFPGGIHLRWLTDVWGTLGKALDRNEAGDFFGYPARLAIRGTRPVDDDRNRRKLQAAVAEHLANGDVTQLPLGIVHRDDPSPGLGLTADAVSPHTRLAAIRRTGAPIYLYTGWFDASYVLSEINLFLNLEGQPRKLVIGPWDHGGWHNISPCARSDEPAFDHAAEALRFFDAVLLGRDNGIFREKPVAYYTMGEERWKFADTWPPPGPERATFYLAEGNTLSREAPSSPDGADRYAVDPSAGTGKRSRWDSLVNPLHGPIRYSKRRKADEKLLCYTSLPLRRPLEVTGHPVVTLHVSSSARDGAFFVYLEDVAPDGKVTYITEGMLRALHRKLSEETPPYRTVTPYHSFLRRDAAPLVPGETAELVFDLYPTSFLFREGHAIRIALAGADKDHFVQIPEEPPTVRVHRSRTHPSRIDLPAIEH